ncbi:MAG: putative monooxygenase [Mycobacterium sp.]|nr:putative monooxygenase [Mycobacterium sp.]
MSSVRIGIIGSGFGGMAAAIELKKAGHHDIVMFEKSGEVGGVWRDNTYPGAAVDVPSPYYSFSYEPNPVWPHRFSHQPDILGYLKHVADVHDLHRHIRFHTEVKEAEFDADARTWRVRTTDGGECYFDVLVSAVGLLTQPVRPRIEGQATFAGPVFHSAEWDHSVDVAGKRVGIIGTGASAIQIVPAIQPTVEAVTVFQRTPPYVLPRLDIRYRPIHHRVFRRVPLLQRLERLLWFFVHEFMAVALLYASPLGRLFTVLARRQLERAVGDPALREELWPDYPIGCKRILVSSDYFPALTKPNAEVVTEPITEITPTGVSTADGARRALDVLVYCTGFKAHDFLPGLSIRGIGGTDLHQYWSEGARAYLGMTVPNFPNFLIIYGPNTNTGTASVVYILETQARYLRRLVDHVAATGQRYMPCADVADAFDARTQRSLSRSVWSACASWYRDPSGRISTNWPYLPFLYRRRARFRARDFQAVG